MKITLVNSDVVGSYKASLFASNAALSRVKNNFFKLLATERLSVLRPCLYIKFNSPINDGYLNSNERVAEFFFSSYKYGEKHWSDEVDHVYPIVKLYPFSSAEVSRYSSYIDSVEFLSSGSADDILYSSCNRWDLQAEQREDHDDDSVSYERYIEFREETRREFVYNAELGSNEELVYITKYEKHFFYNLDKLKSMSGVKFNEWISIENRVYFEIDKEEGSFLDNTLIGFSLSLIGGFFGAFTFILARAVVPFFIKSSSGSSTKNSDDTTWTLDSQDEDDILAVPPLPNY